MIQCLTNMTHNQWLGCLSCIIISTSLATDQLFPRMGSEAARLRRYPRNTADPDKAKAMAALAAENLISPFGSKDGDIYDMESKKLLGKNMNNTNFSKDLMVDPKSGWGLASQLTKAILDEHIPMTDIMDGHSQNGTGANYGIPTDSNVSNGTVQYFDFNNSDVSIPGAYPKPIKMLPYVIQAGDPYHPDGNAYNIPPRADEWGTLPRYDTGEAGGPRPWATPLPVSNTAVKVEGGRLDTPIQPTLARDKKP